MLALAALATASCSPIGMAVGAGAVAHPEHLVAFLKARHIFTDRLDLPGDIKPRHPVFGFQPTGGHAHQQGRAVNAEAVAGV